ncbi:alkaline phosphatase family protein [Maioricimonas sp. JC845]|uniref:alkaline phosphatase family protein n=1 Tax=Maioricimonas sp. JC845 TaxID=3232138 RepID=UPI00345831AF
MSQNKVLVFGIDGATFDIIRPAIERGKMTNLKKLMDAGASGPLQSTIHPITPMAWTSFATGTNAGKHGIFDFARIDNDRILLNNGCDRRMPAIWTHLTEQQRPSVVVNVPFTYPPEQINGVMVPGFEAPYVTRDVFHPESVYDDLLKEFGHYEFDWTFPIGRKLDVAGYREQCRKTIDHRGETSLHLLKNYPWDFFMVVFSTPDHVQHVFWKMEDGHAAIEDIYDQCDQWLGRYLEAIDDDTTVVIMSDHGFGAIEKIVYLDNWLEQEGFLKRAQPGMKQKVIPALKRTLQRVLPTSLRKRISGRLAGLKGRLEAQQFGGTLDWANTKAFSYGMYGNIYINAKGTWPHGIVEPDQYDAVCQQVIDRLMELKDPDTGQPVVDKVHRRQDLYSGEQAGQAPDLVVQWKDYAYYTKRGLDTGTDIFADDLMIDASEFPHTGTHRLDGVFVAKGPNIRPGMDLSARIIDLAPTILKLLGIHPGAQMDGRVLDEIFASDVPETTSTETSGPLATGAVKQAGAISEEEEEAVRERLRSLGYIE